MRICREKVKFYYSQKNYYDTTDVTDVWFIYLKKLDDVITWDGAFHSRKDDEVYIREQGRGGGRWRLDFSHDQRPGGCKALSIPERSLTAAGSTWIRCWMI